MPNGSRAWRAAASGFVGRWPQKSRYIQPARSAATVARPPCGRVVRLKKMHFDFPRCLRHAHGLILVQVALHCTAALDCNLITHQLAQPVDHCALNLVDRVGWIDDMTPDVARHPNPVDLQAIVPLYPNLSHLGKITEMTKMTGNPHA